MSLPLHPAKEPLISEYALQASPGFGKNEAQVDVVAMRSRDLRIKRRIRVFRVIQKILSTLLSILIAGTMTYALVKYYTTKNHNAHGTSIWASPTMLWPTFMLLAVSLVTVVLNIFTICAYFRGVEKANTTSSVAGYIGYALLAVHVLVWAVSIGLFKMANIGKDLWGYSCGSQADAIQEEVQSFVDFGKLCTTQTGAFYTTIIQAVIYVLTFIIYVWSMQRMMAKKKLEELGRLEAGHGNISTTLKSNYPWNIYHGSESGKITVREPITRELGPSEVAVRITHSGICFTDVHHRRQGACGLGHEGIGIVEQVGSVTRYIKVGDRVVVGYVYSTCGHCIPCMTGYRQYCKEAKNFGLDELDQGTLGDYAIREEQQAFKVPDEMDSKYAGPFVCAGPTVYQALVTADLAANAIVGVVGVGGLGHLAIQFAKAMGYTVIVYSSTDSKREDAFKLGADEFYTTKGVEKLELPGVAEGKREGVNCMIFTTTEVPDLKTFFPALAPQAWVIPLTVQMKDLAIPYIPFLVGGYKLTFGAGAARQNTVRMLEFAAKHNIHPWVEEFPMTEEGLNKAFDRLESGKMRYRAIAVAQ